MTPSKKRARTVGTRRSRIDPAALRERLSSLAPDAPFQLQRTLAERLHRSAPVAPPAHVPHVRPRIHERLVQRLRDLAPATPDDARRRLAQSLERLVPQGPPAVVKPVDAALSSTPRHDA
jgi:hypothetical protein